MRGCNILCFVPPFCRSFHQLDLCSAFVFRGNRDFFIPEKNRDTCSTARYCYDNRSYRGDVILFDNIVATCFSTFHFRIFQNFYTYNFMSFYKNFQIFLNELEHFSEILKKFTFFSTIHICEF